MTTKAKIIATSATIAGLLAIGVTDALTTVDNTPFLALLETDDSEVPIQVANSSSSLQQDTSSVPSGGIAKATGPDVRAAIDELGLVANQTQEAMFLPQVIQDPAATVNTAVLLNKNERAGLIAWTDSSKVKIYFVAVKEALHQSFSPEVKDLIDETQRRPNQPVRNFLTFIDPGISEERIAFARVRERLYEIHIAQGQEEAMFELLDALTM